MTTTTCPHEEAVAAAVRSGIWSPDLRAHRDGCLRCAELTLVIAALTADAEELAAIDAPLPEPAAIWLRAQLASRELQYQRATRAIIWIQRLAVAIAMAVAIAFAPGVWSFFTGVFADLSLNFLVPNLPRAAGSPLLVLMVSMIVLGGLALWELTAAHEN